MSGLRESLSSATSQNWTDEHPYITDKRGRHTFPFFVFDMKYPPRFLTAAEVFAAGITGLCWGWFLLANFFSSFNALPYGFEWYDLFWLPLVPWAAAYLANRLPLKDEAILALNERMRKPELIAILVGLAVSVPTAFLF